MTKTLSPALAVSLFLSLGNAQEAGTVGPSHYGVQGNVATSRALKEAEMQAALQEARRVRALKESMVVPMSASPVATTPEQFLAANRPAVPLVRTADPENSPERTSVYVPEFQQVEASPQRASPPTPPPALAELPTKKTGLFDRLKAKPRTGFVDEGIANPYLLEQPAPPEAVSNATVPAFGSPETGGVGSAAPAPKGNLLGRLFGQKENRDPKAEESPRPSVSVVPLSDSPETASEGGESAPTIP